jgi:hypothetical protein
MRTAPRRSRGVSWLALGPYDFSTDVPRSMKPSLPFTYVLHAEQSRTKVARSRNGSCPQHPQHNEGFHASESSAALMFALHELID